MDETKKTSARNALVLFSGGMDSVVALHWAKNRPAYREVRALTFSYGQVQAAEIMAAQWITKQIGVPWTCLGIDQAVRGDHGLRVAPPGSTLGIPNATLAGRNLIFLSIAAGEAVRRWPQGDVDLVVGCNRDDVEAGFPDCHPTFLGSIAPVLKFALGQMIGDIAVAAPLISLSKGMVLGLCAAQPDEVLERVRASVSCYAAHEPGMTCGVCTPCLQRKAAFAFCNIEDRRGAPGWNAP